MHELQKCTQLAFILATELDLTDDQVTDKERL